MMLQFTHSNANEFYKYFSSVDGNIYLWVCHHLFYLYPDMGIIRCRINAANWMIWSSLLIPTTAVFGGGGLMHWREKTE